MMERINLFRETNYNPEVFYESPDFTFYIPLKTFVGFEHESNGAREPESKSWNRIYVAPETTIDVPFLDTFRAQLKWWYRIPEKEKDSPDDPYGDENPDIENYYGNKELRFELKRGYFHLLTMFRWNLSSGHGAQQLDLILPMPGVESLKWHVQYWNGYGESLIDFDRSVTRFGLGIMLIH